MTGSSTPADAEPRLSTVLNGRVRLWQPAHGYRAGLDAALLAAACDAKPGERVLDVGCGPGAALLAAAVRRLDASFLGLEREPQALVLAERNIAENDLTDRVRARAADVAAPFRTLGEPRVDLVMANPPFFDDPSALRAPAASRRAAWIADDGLARWLAFLLEAARDGGCIHLIHRADALPALLAGLSAKAGSFQLRPVHPFADAPAKRVLLRAIRGGRVPFTLLPPLILHPREGAKHTPEAEAILRGEAAVEWL